MLGNTYDTQVCSMARALELVGERWSLLIMRDAVFAGVTRFSDFEHNLGIAPNVLASRLGTFLDSGIMVRREHSERPNQYEYVLTEMGRDLTPALIALTRWGDRWAAPDEPPIIFTHSECGEAIHQERVCPNCGTIDTTHVRAKPGPGMPAEYLANRRPRRTT